MQDPSRLPTGVITFLFTDIEGSTAMVQRLGRDAEAVFADHDRVVRKAILEAGGTVVRTEGDAFFAVFTNPTDCIRAAFAAQVSLGGHAWPAGGNVQVRMGVHTGEGRRGVDDYVGIDVHRAARIAAAGHGGQILVSEATRSLAGELEPGMIYRDLGRHRLKDLERSEHIYQVIGPGHAEEFPPIRTAGTPTTLPAQRSEFVGRNEEMTQVKHLLERNRLVTLTGMGGTGKTRLAIHVARSTIDRFSDGVHFVPLDDLSDSDRVVASISKVLGTTGDGNPLSSVIEALGSGTILLVLDNFEHVLDAAPALSELLVSCPGLSLLVTSQIRLRIRGEQVYSVPPLGLPDTGETSAVGRSDSGVLFLKSAQAIDPTFEINATNSASIASIVERLDGLPLAIELAAARIPLFGIDGLLSELQTRLTDLGGGYVDAPERHHTLAAAVEWSYELLDEHERAFLRIASVFLGGFSLEAARFVHGTHEGPEVAEIVGSLIEKSLVRSTLTAGSPRFSMLEAIRSYGQRRLTDAGEVDHARRRHAEFFTRIPRTASASFRGPDGYATMERLGVERANISSALEWAAQHDPDLGLGAMVVLARFYAVSGSLDEGREVAESLLQSPIPASPGNRMTGLLGAASIAYWLLDYERARDLYLEAIATAESEQDDSQLGEALFGLAYTYVWLQRIDDAESMADRAIKIAEDSHDDLRKAHLLTVRGTCQWMRGELEASMMTYGEVSRRAGAFGDDGLELSSDRVLAAGLVRIGEYREALPFLLDILGRCEALNDDGGIIETIDYLSVAATGIDPQNGIRLAGSIRAITDRRGGTVLLSALGIPDPREIAAVALDTQEIQRLWNEGREMDLPEAVAFVTDWATGAGITSAPVDVEFVLEAVAGR